MSLDWYRIEDLEISNTFVVTLWPRWELSAMRLSVPRDGDPRTWLARDAKGQSVMLPPKGREQEWGLHPTLWRPHDVKRWGRRLPNPVTSVEPGRFTSLGQRFSAVEAAIETEAKPLPPVPDKLPWWMDEAKLTYSEIGAISRQEVEGRVMRAWIAHHYIRLDATDQPTDRMFCDLLVKLGRSIETAEDYALWTNRPFRIQGRDIDDVVVALGWLRWLDREQLEVLLYRARQRPMTWREIGKEMGMSHETARTIYSAAIDVLWWVANDPPKDRRMEAVREGNRAYALRRSQ